MNAIIVENVSKRYVIDHQGRSDTLRDALAHGVHGLWGRLNQGHLEKEEFWALKDVSFEVKPGEVLGIIGRNGAGKSTLLKILSRITEPTTGRISLRGRVASLLEVGTGFHPELSGRENIYLNGAILGMSRAEITRKFDEIVAFAEVERFLDTPVKRYSSGMYVRLAFAVAAHLEPEILIVDEVLAVGDHAFQKKCLGKMQQVANTEGRTVLFVSHTMPAVQNLCSSCIWLRSGSVVRIGASAAVIADYLSDGNRAGAQGGQVLESSEDFSIYAIEVNGSTMPTLVAGQPCRFVLSYRCKNPGRFPFGLGVTLTVRLNDEKIVNLWSAYSPQTSIQPAAEGRIECVVPAWPFREGQLTVDVYVHAWHGPTVEWVRNMLTVHSQDGDYYGVGKLSPPGEGILFLPHDWSHTPGPAQP
jgi:lipopolysaccharide transport system ATP-binding protein